MYVACVAAAGDEIPCRFNAPAPIGVPFRLPDTPRRERPRISRNERTGKEVEGGGTRAGGSSIAEIVARFIPRESFAYRRDRRWGTNDRAYC